LSFDPMRRRAAIGLDAGAFRRLAEAEHDRIGAAHHR
jgi:hypothetical protein